MSAPVKPRKASIAEPSAKTSSSFEGNFELLKQPLW